jgi:hypothetical protein
MIGTRRPERAAGRMFTIELIRGPSWQEPVETIDRRECDTDSFEFALGEALHWLREIQHTAPARGATHYRVVGQGGTVIGGPR